MNDDKINFMRDTTLFSNWSKSLIRTTIKQLRPVKYTKGREVVTQNKANPFLYIIVNGQFKLTIKMCKPYDEEADSQQKKHML